MIFGYESFEIQVASEVELNSWDDAWDELKENQQSKVRLDFLPIFSHPIRHTLQHLGMLAWVYSWHC